VAQLYLRALGSLYVASYDSQGYGRGIRTILQPGGPGPHIHIPQEQDGHYVLLILLHVSVVKSVE
jgi:hypothetical protein